MGRPQVPIILVCLMMASSTHILHAKTSPDDFLEPQNAARAAVGVAPLVWDEEVAAYAQSYAKERSQDCAMQHSSTEYGENIAAGSGDFRAEDAVRMWVEEKNLYEANSNSCVGGDECLHYTQVVWKDTARVGCGTAPCQNGWTFVSCNYDPAGNFIGERPF